MKPWSEWKANGLEGTEDLNPGLVANGLHPKLEGKLLPASAEGVQLFFKASDCEPGAQHVHLRTPHGVKKPEDLECQLCPEFVGTRVEWQTERQVIEHIRQSENGHKLLQEVVCQWVPKWWSGRVDFYHYPSKTIIQVDGEPHFEGVRKLKPCTLLQNDMKCCSKVWQQQARMLRIHYADIDASAEYVQRCIAKQGPFIVLSPSFAMVGCSQGSISWSYTPQLGRILGCSAITDTDGTIWFFPPTL